jgi:hypothetical protein
MVIEIPVNVDEIDNDRMQLAITFVREPKPPVHLVWQVPRSTRLAPLVNDMRQTAKRHLPNDLRKHTIHFRFRGLGKWYTTKHIRSTIAGKLAEQWRW